MRKIFVAVLALLLSPILITPDIANAQTRPRRVGQTASAPATPQQTTAPARPPVLVGATPNGSSRQQQTSQPQNTGPEEVGEGDVVRVNTTLVTVPVRVMDRNGLYIPDLRQEDFRLSENGVEQQIAYFASIEKPFTVALVLDTSNSTHFRMEEIQDAAIEFVNQLRPDDRVMVVSFDEHINVLSEATSDRYALRDAIRRSRTGGNTKLYDAVDFVMQRMNRVEGRKAIVLFTDGVDTASHGSNYQKTLQEAEEFDGLIYSVQYDTYQ
ncbi:MAG TPA: VWA domain-containing protein, partial [Pyrinomonadaceae bacterium]|nr:VWA domain-containing protein [Pyrinomonadaceae bacterium]